MGNENKFDPWLGPIPFPTPLYDHIQLYTGHALASNESRNGNEEEGESKGIGGDQAKRL